MTRAVNEIDGTNMTQAEYAKHWESSDHWGDSGLSWGEITRGVDLIDQIGSFDAASIAKDLGADLQEVADTISQAAAVEALNGTQDFISERANSFKKRRDFVVESLNNIKGINCLKPEGAFYVFPRVRKNGLSSKNISKYLLEDYNLATVPGSSFGQNGEGYLRFSCAGAEENIIGLADCINSSIDSFKLSF